MPGLCRWLALTSFCPACLLIASLQGTRPSVSLSPTKDAFHTVGAAVQRVGTVSTLIGLDAGSTLLQRANILMGTAEMQAEARVQLALKRGVNFHCQHQEGPWASACGGCHSSKPRNPNSGVQGSPGGTAQGPGSTSLDPPPNVPRSMGSL